MKSSDEKPWGIRLNRELDYDDDRDLEAAMADNPCGGTSRRISLAGGQRDSGTMAEISAEVHYGTTAGCGIDETGRIPYGVRGPKDPLVQALRYIGLGAGDDYSREDIIARLSDREIRGCLPAGLLSTLCSHVGVRLDYFSIREERRGHRGLGSARAEAVALVRARAALYTRAAIVATAAKLPVRPRSPEPGKGVKN